MSIMKNAIVYDNVNLGENSTVEPFSILGISPSDLYLEVNIGNNALIRSGTYIYEGNDIGSDFQTGNKTNIREHNKIGDNVSIGTNSVIEHHIEIGDNVRIHSNVFIPEYTIIKQNSWIGPNAILTNAKFPISEKVKENLIGPVIEEGSIIGAGSIIMPGINIGIKSLIGSGCVVTKNVEPYSVMIGNPAKRLCHISELPDNPYNL